MRRVRLIYALFCTIWAAYVIQKQIGFFHTPDSVATLRGAVLCVLLLAVFPAILGYLLLFRAFPWVNRLVRR